MAADSHTPESSWALATPRSGLPISPLANGSYRECNGSTSRGTRSRRSHRRSNQNGSDLSLNLVITPSVTSNASPVKSTKSNREAGNIIIRAIRSCNFGNAYEAAVVVQPRHPDLSPIAQPKARWESHEAAGARLREKKSLLAVVRAEAEAKIQAAAVLVRKECEAVGACLVAPIAFTSAEQVPADGAEIQAQVLGQPRSYAEQLHSIDDGLAQTLSQMRSDLQAFAADSGHHCSAGP